MIALEQYSESLIQSLHSQNQSGTNPDILKTLTDMREDIQKNGNKAVEAYTQKFDGVSSPLKAITKEEIKAAYAHVPKDFIQAVDKAITNIRDFHTHQLPKNWTITQEENGITYGTRFHPLDRVCLYAPGGQTPYFSTVIMNAIPAAIAGVSEKVLVTPPQKDGKIAPQILVTADKCGVDEIYAVGGAQAIFACAEGTETIKKVDKIVGPGNIYVDLAKQMVYGKVDIDKPAGPSDVLVYIEDTTYANSAAAELLAQLEHDPLAIAMAVSPSKACLLAIREAIAEQLPTLSRKAIIEQSLKNSALIEVKSREEGINATNAIAPEHLVILLDDYQPLLDSVKHAGSIFCGPHTPVALGDYYAGPNHVLPTSGAAKFASPLTVMDFFKCSNFLNYSEKALSKCQDDLKALTAMEGFDAHFAASQARLDS